MGKFSETYSPTEKSIKDLVNILEDIELKEYETYAIELNTEYQNFLEGKGHNLMTNSKEYLSLKKEIKNLVETAINMIDEIKNSDKNRHFQRERVDSKFVKTPYNNKYDKKIYEKNAKKTPKIIQLRNKIPRNYWKEFNAAEILKAIEEVYPINKNKEKVNNKEDSNEKVNRYKIFRPTLPNKIPAKKSTQVDNVEMAKVQNKSRREEGKHQVRKVNNPKSMGNGKLGQKKKEIIFRKAIKKIKAELNDTYRKNQTLGF